MSVLLYGCESWTLTAYRERRVQAFENKCLAYHTESIKRTTTFGSRSVSYSDLRSFCCQAVKHCKLSWFGHICRHDTLPKIILQGSVDGRHRRCRPRKSWKNSIQEWTGQSMSSLLCIAEDRKPRDLSGYPNDAWTSRVLID